MACDRVVERRAEMRALAIVSGEMRVRLGDVGATNGQIEDLGLAAVSRNLEVALGAVDLPQQVRTTRAPAAIVNRERGATLEQSGDAHLIVRVHRPGLFRTRDRE